MKIYTKKGDSAKTSLFSGRRVDKFDSRVAVVGDLDELSAALGMARLSNPDFSDQLQRIQQQLYSMSAIVSAEHRRLTNVAMEPADVTEVEDSIDQVSALLPPLSDFIFPGASEASCRLHVARSVARRAERNMAALQDPAPPEAVLAFMNRLSDLLFVLARLADHQQGLYDVEFKERKERESGGHIKERE